MLNKITAIEAIEGMKQLEDESVDMIFCDLPYGVTKNDWDEIIPPEDMWREYERIIKPNGAIVLTATFKFAMLLVNTATVPFRYDLVWQKNRSTGFLNSKRQPMRQHENILVFYKKQPTCNPQMTQGHKPSNYAKTKANSGTTYGRTKESVGEGGKTERYPTSILPFATVNRDDPERIHPSQKPVKLMEWAILTYTNEGDVVLDNCIGSGATAISAIKTKRQYIGMERDLGKAKQANERVARYIAELELESKRCL